MLKVVCAYCRRDMGFKMGPHGVTHGMCNECYKRETMKRRCTNCGDHIPYDSPEDLCNGCWHDAHDTDMHPPCDDEQGRAEEERQLADDIRRF